VDRGADRVSQRSRSPDERLFERLGFVFQDEGLLETALTHPSHSYERDGSRGNERLEFLGDAVLDLIIARLLYQTHPGWAEGDLTRARATLVNTAALAAKARGLELGDYVRLGGSERRGGGSEKDSILAGLFEAVLGAMYLEGGLEPVEALVRRIFPEAHDAERARPEPDPKTRLNEWALARFGRAPSYRMVDDTGVENADDRFTVELLLDDEVWGSGTGRTKRAAERIAALRALHRGESLDE
jgi:ribonuclease-3